MRARVAFANAAVRHGATIQTGVLVTGIAIDGGRVTGVTTDDGNVSAEIVVLAAGAWSAELAKGIGIDLPVVTHGFQAMTTKPAAHQLDQVIASKRRLLSLKQLPDGRYLIGGGWPGAFTLDFPRGRSTVASQSGNLAAAVGVFPPVAFVGIDKAWLGIEAVAIDEVPIIGPVEGIDGLIIATGFSGHGFALAPAVGEAVSELIDTGNVPTALAELTFARFAANPASTDWPVQNVG